MTLCDVFLDEPTVTKAEALNEVRRHNCLESEFLNEMGDSDEYNGRQVLEWLGY